MRGSPTAARVATGSPPAGRKQPAGQQRPAHRWLATAVIAVGHGAATGVDTPDRTSADIGHTIMPDLGVEQRKHRIRARRVVLLQEARRAGAGSGQWPVAVK